MRVCRPKLRIEPRAVGEGVDTVFYGLRRVDPGRGAVSVVGRPDARAISVDGVFQQILTLAPAPRRRRARDGAADTVRYCRVGSWSRAGGLSRVPVNPKLDVGRMIAACEALVADLPHAESRLPFARADDLELWSLDRDGQPLALLATALTDSDLDSIKVRRCGAGGHARLVDAIRRLYPAFLDLDLFKRIRVEARLRRSLA
jgi:hypothetical protein